MAELFADRFVIDREVGRGGFGTIYLARDNRLRGRAVALKVLHPGLSADPAVVHLFEQESGILASLVHDHIIPVYDAGVWEGRRYIVMQYLEGRSLAQVVADEGAQPAARVRPWLQQAASALAYAHEQGVLHRDVKSANLLLDRTGSRLYVTDFGLAQAVEASGGSSTANTGTLTGTAAYRAPEVAKTGHTVASDLYGLGVVAYELLAGRLPFLAADPLSMLLLHATEPVPLLPASVPQELADLVLRLLAKDPAARPASTAQLLALLDALAEAERTRREAEEAARRTEEERQRIAADKRMAAEAERARREAEQERQRQTEEERRRIEADKRMAAEAERQAREEAKRHAAATGRGGRGPLPWVLVGVAGLVLLFGGWGLARLLRPASTLELGIGSTWTSPVDGMVQVYVPAGEFLMGAADSDSDYEYDETPRHKVTLDAYWIDRTEVTQDQYQQCVAAGKCEAPSCSGSGQGNHPVVCVSWQNAVDYCVWAGRRLPTEAEWEKAARGADGRIYPWGNQAPDDSRLNYNNNVGNTSAVGSYPSGAGPYGALDMAGNVWEWVADWYGEQYYAGSPTWNPLGPDAGQERVLRGGSWNRDQGWVRAAFRFRAGPVLRLDRVGFRCVRSD